ncbi:fatty acid desaturase [Paenibacillus senegalensis]|uniref:fatty acid desaturase n=1 Tax=Paenibacillus senegalensis TaxID=1465766 RepID=UPI000289C23A|nr:fatty acid desaturase [Paenibacillus senegalensis]
MTQSKMAQLKKSVVPYERPDSRSSTRQILNTLLPLFILWFLSYQSLSISYWLTVPLLMLAAAFLVRTFIIFHDCCHQSFFKSRKANDWLGTFTGILTLVPYKQWRYSHSVHHASSSNLDKRGVGDIWILTVEEYVAAPLWKKISYRLYRNPLIMFGLGPIYTFMLQYRFNRRGAKRAERMNTYLTNLGIAVLYSLLIWAVGWQSFLLIQLPIIWFSGLLGIWLFYVQHQFEDTYFEHEDEWDYVKAAVEGSSYYQLPKVLQWLTGNIGFHHVHHLSPRVPNYLLEKVHNETVPLQKATTISLTTSLKALRFRLWDETQMRFVSFRDIKPLLVKRLPKLPPMPTAHPRMTENK